MPTQIIRYFVLRWYIEVTFEEIWLILVLKRNANGWTRLLPEQHHLLMGLFSFVILFAFNMYQTKALVSMEMASCYDKKGELTCSDILVIVRRSIWANIYFQKLTISLIRLNTQKKHRYIDLSALFSSLTDPSRRVLCTLLRANDSGKMAKVER
ncbi:TPA: hypothetical protein JBA92_15130 [Legionella pneumophila subsp. pneumophila]|uniref:hypothetical protein n=1 Tax=Legionella pneumophila TaxID=446 RepID=UPI0007708813|nr:hypothetical protein [Legionella pneumophila]CZI73670.1 Uncharacterised protein [Legionella pneumophila]HAT8922266.1 hypothetical protein [Legionella pneumophila subsp. pneumophila]HAT9388330.1 hypothetical protein [Legionella pneumophila subsp. pneumophila]